MAPVFAKTPSKNGYPPRFKKILQQRTFFRLYLGLFRPNDDGGSHLILPITEIRES
jgi:hypothetical protein